MGESLTVVVPVFNEEECITPLVEELNKFLAQVEMPTSILFVNDGSTDTSLQIIEAVCLDNPQYAYISLQKNSGLSTALKAGIDNTQTTYMGYIDADLQTSPLDFIKLLAFTQEFDLVMGYRENRKDTGIKKLSSSIANGFRQWLLTDDIKDNGCPLKIIKTDIAKRIYFFNGAHRFLPNSVILLGGKVKQVPVQHFPRYGGVAKYNLMNRLKGPFIDSLAFRWIQKRFINYQIGNRSK